MRLFGREKGLEDEKFSSNLRRFELLKLKFYDTVNPHMMKLNRGRENILYVVNEHKEKITRGFVPTPLTWYRRIS